MKSFSKNVIYKEISEEIEKNPFQALNMINGIEKDFSDVSYIALLIKILCLNNNWSDAYEIYKNIPINLRKKRFVTPILKKISELSKDIAFKFFKCEIINKFLISEEDIKLIYNINNFNEIFEIISKNHIIMEENIFNCNNLCKLDKNCCRLCNNNLEKVQIQPNLKKILL